jgi:two-component system, OmpR family, phosphate regulon response regulator PhoB
VLVVEDEPDIAALIAYQLAREGFNTETVSDGASAIVSIGRERPDLIVLDRMLPGLSGDEVLERLRTDPATRRLPVLMLTAKREQEDRIEGLELGADDYLTKPFSPKELVLRAKAILRRVNESNPQGAGLLTAGPICLDVESHRASINEIDVSLTPTEFRLLQALVERRGRTQSRSQLLERAWSLEAGVSDRIRTRTVDMHIRRLREKLGEVGDRIQTVRGFGYRLNIPEGSA